MRSLHIPFKEELSLDMPLQKVSAVMDELEKNSIDKAPWPAGYQPKVNFATAHNDRCLFIKFYVAEQAIQAVYHRSNDPVYKDTCVEAFIAFNREAEYYNFEFNCIGTCLAGYGTGREGREALPEANISLIKRLSLIDTDNDKPFVFQWQLMLALPLKVFYKHHFTGLKGSDSRGNFHKCGDELPEPHYLVWNNIEAAQPDFHLSGFFGKIKFG